MNTSAGCINIILAFCSLALFGCKTAEQRKQAKQGAFLRFHLEINPDGTPYNGPVTVYRADPIIVNVEASAALDEAMMKEVSLVDADRMGGFAVKVTFNEEGTRKLDSLTIQYRGRRLAVHAGWTEMRWLAAPMINKRISNGVFIFTPDASREESERIVAGLKNVIKKLSEPYTF